MKNDSFQELLRRMPTIAKAVNAFESEDIQKQAYQELIKAFVQSDEEAEAADTARKSKKQRSKKDAAAQGEKSGDKPTGNGAKSGDLSTADILAAARGNQKSAPAAKASPAADKKKEASPPSELEGIKEASLYLKGPIPQELVDGSDHFGKESIQLLKHHGTYQQDNRDERKSTSGGKSAKSYIFMVRTKIPSGIFTSPQLLEELDLCDEMGNGTLRITSRQGLQLHSIPKDNLKDVIARINAVNSSTLGACGDVNRNVMCCPAPYTDEVHLQMQALSNQLAAHFAPRTSAYHEIWLKDTETNESEQIAGAPAETIEPIYGKHYLPRKFKMGIALPDDNCIDVYTHDLGLLAIVRDGKIIGYNVLVGGGQGRTPTAEKTFPALGKRMAFCTPEQVLEVATAVVKVQRDFGNRADRKIARMKYLIHDWGLERFKAKVEEYFGSELPGPQPDDVTAVNDHMGWDEQGDGKLFYGLNVENGRILDTESMQMKTAFREICRQFNPGIRFTANQSLLFTDLDPACKDDFTSILKKHHVPLSADFSNARRWSIACVAWPTCGLSITESERALPGIMDDLEVELAKLGLSSEEFVVRMTGCPNGCARPYNCDVGLVGRAKDKYTIFLGGRMQGDRLNWEYKDMVPHDEIVPELAKVFTYFKQDREEGESFGDFCERKGQADLVAWSEVAQPA
ncbi:NADPH-dependent assimilatory sulfite reductase hemoprotein subunit [Lignipirellula cremea]|uniref:Sulfite reductase [ferredoxin] n=1 Tax=Lignipirellula cremea TaxID=2528010 RepID=A0A518DUK4_9BACT|nr:NADPH-dependent assimilatory sulfite reductase hemoprotein subunit [Lignipirellula cremea]QDU95521.1 Sulfite reductase [ferredoxin] [Lignipirellula cremea]